ncbi:Kinesin heavy chain-like [Oopsacas minuta]|uniref:Kinesin heavy chain-like n=1 Tax=Oopsacas minuta TaxID=111878 RepID=A0AAV7JBU7_9METZ|nr:Kinesin heavy chain-like [Oopsacas minuta]
MSEDAGSCNIRVVCRVRPLNNNEISLGGEQCVTFPKPNVISLLGAYYPFDKVFEPHSTQYDVYDFTAKPIIKDVLNGFNGTIFAYGQTASGKTHTMEGNLSKPELFGITPRIVNDIFDYIYNMDPECNVEFTLKVSYFEVYNEEIRDLLDLTKGKLSIHEDRSGKPFVKGLSDHAVASPEEVMELIEEGKSNRHVSVTNMNEHSSRSHSVFIFQVCQENIESKRKLLGKLYLVDLAGSEKAKKTGAEGSTLNEAKNINMSLLCLGNVIEGLVLKKAHISYRDSKLTRILQESLGGNARTTIAICCSPSSFNEMETKNTILFGSRAKTIKNTIIRNEELTADEWKARYNKLKKQYRGIVSYLNSVQEEVKRWRLGEKVPEEDWAKLVSTSTPGDDDKSSSLAGSLLTDTKTDLNSIFNETSDSSVNSTHISPLPQAPAAPPDWEEERAQLISSVDKKEEELNDLRQELEEVQESHNEIEEERKVYQEKAEELQSQNDTLKNKLEETKNDVVKSQDDLLQVISELQTLALTTEELSNTNQTMSERCSELEYNLVEEKRSSDTVKSTFKTFKSKIVQVLTTLFSELRTLGSTLKSEKTVMFDPNSIDNQLNEELFMKLTIYLTEMKSNAQIAFQNLSNAESSINEMKITIRDMEKDLEKHKRNNRQSELKVKKILGQFRMYSTQSEENLHSPSGDQERITNLTSQVEKQIDSHKSELEAVRTELAMKNRILIETEGQVVEREDQIKDLELDLRYYQDSVKEKENTLKQLRVDLQATSDATADLYSISQPLEVGTKKMSGIRKDLLGKLKANLKMEVINIEEERLKLAEKNFNQLNLSFKEKQREADYLSQQCIKFENILTSKEKQMEKQQQYMVTMTDVYEKTVIQLRNESEILKNAQKPQPRVNRGRIVSSSSTGPRVALVKTIRAGAKVKRSIPEPTKIKRTESGQRILQQSTVQKPLHQTNSFPEQVQSKIRPPAPHQSHQLLHATGVNRSSLITPPPALPKNDFPNKLPKMLRPKTSADHFATKPTNGHI